jgi:hypothetical protein
LPPGAGHDFTFNTTRWPNGTYNLRTSIQERALTGSCALGAAVAQSDPYNETVANPGGIDMISGAGSSGTTATVTARLVDAGLVPPAPYVTNTAAPIQIMRTHGYSFLGFPFTVGNGGTPAGSLDGVTFNTAVAPTAFPTAGQTGYTGAGFTLYTDTIEGYGPAGIADGETKAWFNRLTVTTDSGPATVECSNVFKNTTSSLTGADKFNGFSNCFSTGSGKMVAPLKQADGSYTGGSTVVEGHTPATLTFTINGVSSDPVPVDRVTGLATGTIATPDVPAGHDVPVTVASSDDGFLTPATAIGHIDFKGGTLTDYTGDANAFWDEDYTATASVVSEIGHVPVNEGSVTFTRGTQVSDPAPVVNGVATATLHAVDDPSADQTISAAFSGTDLFNSSTDSEAFVTKPRPTHVDYTGPSAGNYNDVVHLAAHLTDVRSGGNLVGQTIAFKLGSSDAVSAVTDGDGVATTDVPIQSKVGTYDLTTSFFDVARYVGDTVTHPFKIGFQYSFQDTLIGNHGVTRLNPDTQQVGYTSGQGVDSRVADNSYQLSLYLPTVVGFPSTDPGALPTLPEEWNILNLPRLSDLFGLLASPPTVTPPALDPGSVTPPALPELPLGDVPITLPMASPNRSSARAGAPTVPAGGSPSGLLPTEGMTFGEFIDRLTTSGIPTSLSVCELLSGSTCERRFVVAAAITPDGPDVIGVFDVKTGLFASLVSPLKSPVLGASLGSCATPLAALCIAAPVLPDGPPTVTPPAAPDPTGLLDAIGGLLGGLQGLPDQITAPPAPPAPEVPAPTSTAAAPSPVALPTTSLLPGKGKSLATRVPTYWLG